MRAVIMAGGKGTRLRPYTAVLPKPLMPVGDLSILEILIRQLEKAGFDRVTISLGHLAHLVKAVLNEGASFGLEIDYSIEDTPHGTCGPLSLIDDLDETFLVMNGDVLTNLNYQDLLQFHRKQRNHLTIAAYRRKVFIDYGVLHRSGVFLEKYDEKPVFEYEVSMGIYVFEPKVLEHIQPMTCFDIPDLVHVMLNRGDNVSIYPFNGMWYDLGREEDFRLVQEQLTELLERVGIQHSTVP